MQQESRLTVFIAGGSGYIGQPLIHELLKRGHRVRALVRKGSERKLPAGCEPVFGDALEKSSFAAEVVGADCFVQLVGVPHPSPAKARQFREIDFRSGKASIEAAAQAGVKHFVYLSVAHPAPVMKAYIDVRSECEQLISDHGLNATIVRPWYVLGPGHLWPYALIPLYWFAEQLSATRDGARRLGLVRLQDIVLALANSVENPPSGIKIVEVPAIREAGRTQRSAAAATRA